MSVSNSTKNRFEIEPRLIYNTIRISSLTRFNPDNRKLQRSIKPTIVATFIPLIVSKYTTGRHLPCFTMATTPSNEDCRPWDSVWRPGKRLYSGFCDVKDRVQHSKRTMPTPFDLISHRIQATGRQVCTIENGTTTCVRNEPSRPAKDQLQETGHQVCTEANGSSNCIDTNPKQSTGANPKQSSDVGPKSSANVALRPSTGVAPDTSTSVAPKQFAGVAPEQSSRVAPKPSMGVSPEQSTNVEPKKSTGIDPTESTRKGIQASGDRMCTTNKGEITCITLGPKKAEDQKVHHPGSLECTQEMGATTCIDLGLKKYIADMIRAADDQECIKNKTNPMCVGLGPMKMRMKRNKKETQSEFEGEYMEMRLMDLEQLLGKDSYGPSLPTTVPFWRPTLNSTSATPLKSQLVALSSPTSQDYGHYGSSDTNSNDAIGASLNHGPVAMILLAGLGMLFMLLILIKCLCLLLLPQNHKNHGRRSLDIELGPIVIHARSTVSRYSDFQESSSTSFRNNKNEQFVKYETEMALPGESKSLADIERP